LAVFGPFASHEGGPVGGGGEAFVVGGVETEEHGEAALAEGGMGGEGEAVVEFDLGFGFVVEIGELQGMVVGAGDGERQEFVQPTDLAFVEMLCHRSLQNAPPAVTS